MKLDLPFFSSLSPDADVYADANLSSSSDRMPSAIPTMSSSRTNHHPPRVGVASPIRSPRKSPAASSPAPASAAAATSSPSRRPRSSPAEAAFLCVKASLAEDLESEEELAAALTMAGYNPTRKLLCRYWRQEETRSFSFKQFEHFMQTEPKPRKIDLISYFKRLDPEDTGLIPHQILFDALTSTGGGSIPSSGGLAGPMDPEAVRRYLADPALNRGGSHFDYRAFCAAAFETSASLAASSADAADARRTAHQLNTKTYRVKKKPGPPSPQKTATKDWTLARRKGAFYFEGDNVIAHQYALRVRKGSKFQLGIQPGTTEEEHGGEKGGSFPSCQADCQLFVFKVSDSASADASSSSFDLDLVARSDLVLRRMEGNAVWMGYLEEGTYLLVPNTTGCKLKKRGGQPESSVELVTQDSRGSVSLTPAFRHVLHSIYSQVDLDCNGTLSRTEFNLFNWRTSGEEVQDEEWQVVRENFAMSAARDKEKEKGKEEGKEELSLEGFMQLHQMEAEDNGGDSAELWITLNAMGYNALLRQDEASTFEVTARGEEGGDFSLEVCGLKTGGSALDKAAIKTIIQEAKKLDGGVQKDGEVVLYKEETSLCSSWVIQNRTSDHVSVNLDFSGSRNALINHPHMVFRTSLSPKTTVFVAHLVPADLSKDLEVKLKRSLETHRAKPAYS